MAENIKTKSRGAKMLLASLSIAATLSGWAWLTATQPLAQAELDANDAFAQTDAAPILQAGIGASIALPPRATIPNLADLPVRGVREVGDTEFIPQPQAPQSQSQPPAVRQRQNNGGGAQTQSQQSQPQPKPKPVRKAKSSK